MAPRVGSRSGRPLVVTDDPDLLDELLRLAAAAGVDVDVVPEAVAARAAWRQAPLVLAGDDVAEQLVRARLRRRPGVVLVGGGGQDAAAAGHGAAAGQGIDDAAVWRRAVALGAEHVALLPDAEPWLIARLSDAHEGPPGFGVVVGVVGGRGGAGASTLAASLAVTGMRRGRHTILVDADPLGGGVDLAFGGEDAAGVRWPDLATAQGRIAGHALRDALPTVCLPTVCGPAVCGPAADGPGHRGGGPVGGLAVLAWDRGELVDLAPDAMASVLEAASRASDLVVIDLPRHGDDVSQVAIAACDVVLLVVPAEVRAAAAGARVASAVRRFASDLRLVVRGPSPGGLDAADVAAALGLPLAGSIRPEPGLSAALERGEAPAGSGRGPLADFCARLLDALPGAASDADGPAGNTLEPVGRRPS